jgi:hypothetical protein
MSTLQTWQAGGRVGGQAGSSCYNVRRRRNTLLAAKHFAELSGFWKASRESSLVIQFTNKN